MFVFALVLAFCFILSNLSGGGDHCLFNLAGVLALVSAAADLEQSWFLAGHHCCCVYQFVVVVLRVFFVFPLLFSLGRERVDTM